jgi:ribosomal protein S19
MSRSNYKIPYVHKSMFKEHIDLRELTLTDEKKAELLNLKITNNITIPMSLFFFKRGSRINSTIVGERVCIHNGTLFLMILITPDNVGYKLGQFILSRRTTNHKGKQNQRKRK